MHSDHSRSPSLTASITRWTRPTTVQCRFHRCHWGVGRVWLGCAADSLPAPRPPAQPLLRSGLGKPVKGIDLDDIKPSGLSGISPEEQTADAGL